MFEKLGVPVFLQEARKVHPRGRVFSAGLTILIFILVFLIVSSAQGVLLTPILLVAIMADPNFWTLLSSEPTYESTMAYAEQFMAESPAVVIGMLFANIALIAGAFIFCRLFEKRSFASMGFLKGRIGLSLLGGAGFALLLMVCALLFLWAFGTISMAVSPAINIPLLLVLILGFLLQGFAEEILFRGYLMVSLGRVMPLRVAVIISAFFFAFFHSGNAGFSLLGFLNIFLFGILAGLYMIRGGSIWGVGMLHALWNILEGVIFGGLVSGLSMPTSVFLLYLAPDASFLHGGAFGPEGGLGVTFVLTLGIAMLAMKKNKTDVSSENKSCE